MRPWIALALTLAVMSIGCPPVEAAQPVPSASGGTRLWFCVAPDGRVMGDDNGRCRRGRDRRHLRALQRSALLGDETPPDQVFICRDDRNFAAMPTEQPRCPRETKRLNLTRLIQVSAVEVPRLRDDLRLCVVDQHRLVSAMPGVGCPIGTRTREMSEFQAEFVPLVETRFCSFAGNQRLLGLLESARPLRWLIHGASTIAGYNVDGTTVEGEYQLKSSGTGRSIARHITSRYKGAVASVTVEAVAGATSDELLAGGYAQGVVPSLAESMAATDPDVVLLNLNSNDATRNGLSSLDFVAQVMRLLDIVEESGAAVLLIPPFEHFRPAEQSDLYEDQKAQLRLQLGARARNFVPVERTLEDPSRPGFPLVGTTWDGIHPNARGAEMIAAAVTRALPTPEESKVWRGITHRPCSQSEELTVRVSASRG